MNSMRDPLFSRGSLVPFFLAQSRLFYWPLLTQAQTTTTSSDHSPDLGRLLITDQFIADDSDMNAEPSANESAIGADGCKQTEMRSERDGQCVAKPWADFESCEAEKDGSACYDGNSWVNEHCCDTCGWCGDNLGLDLFGRLMVPLGPIIVICSCCAFFCYRQARSQGADQQNSHSVQPAVVGRSG